MIQHTHLTAWQTHAPWPKRSQIEQDLPKIDLFPCRKETTPCVWFFHDRRMEPACIIMFNEVP